VKPADRLFTDLAHAAFAVADVPRTLVFYELLGIREAFRLHHDDGSLMLVYLHVGGDRFIEIFPGGPAIDPGADPNRKGSFMHLCLLTENLRAAVEALRAVGVTIAREPSMGLDTNLQAWIKDPDGNAIELMELSPESPQRRIARGEVPQ
jgi:lactoylglutathione lyase